MNNDSITKAILSVITEDWQTLPALCQQVSQKLGIPPSRLLRDMLALYCGWLVGKGRLDHKRVTTPEGGYYYMCRKQGGTDARSPERP